MIRQQRAQRSLKEGTEGSLLSPSLRSLQPSLSHCSGMIRQQSNSNRIMGHSSKDTLRVDIISKHEIRNPKQFQILEIQNTQFVIWILGLFRI